MKLGIENFRSIRQQEVELAPITVVYGPNGAGKSSLLYALLTLKNVVMNPNQSPNGFFNYGFANLGNYEAVVHDHQTREDIELSLELSDSDQERSIAYHATIGASDGAFCLDSDDLDLTLQMTVTFPYQGNQPQSLDFDLDDCSFKITWTGLMANVSTSSEGKHAQDNAAKVAALLNSPLEWLRRTGMVPLKRGFSKPAYSSTPVSPNIVTEDEVASLLGGNKYLVSKVSYYLEKLFERDFRVHTTPGTAVFSLDATDRTTGTATELVNDGFGVNQAVFLLAKCLYADTDVMCIEEPEIHMHPSAVRRMAGVLLDMKRELGKRFVISTHSEQLVLGLLALVAKKELEPSDLACYLAQKEQKATVFERQEVSENGQIKGGLRPFIEGELEDVRAFLGVSE